MAQREVAHDALTVKNLHALGAGGGDRTHDLLITNQLFFQLNYTGILELKDGIAPSLAEYETAVLLLNYSSIIWYRRWDSNPQCIFVRNFEFRVFRQFHQRGIIFCFRSEINGPPSWIRTCTSRILSSMPLPVGL